MKNNEVKLLHRCTLGNRSLIPISTINYPNQFGYYDKPNDQYVYVRQPSDRWFRQITQFVIK